MTTEPEKTLKMLQPRFKLMYKGDPRPTRIFMNVGSLLGKNKVLDAPAALSAPSHGAWWPAASAADSLRSLLNVPRCFSEISLVFNSHHTSDAYFASLPNIVTAELPPRGRVRLVQHAPGLPFSGYYLELEVGDVSENPGQAFLALHLKVPGITLETYGVSIPLDSYDRDQLAGYALQYLVSPFSRRTVAEGCEDPEFVQNFHRSVHHNGVNRGLAGSHELALSLASIAYRSQEEDRMAMWPRVYDALLFAGDVEAAGVVIDLDEMRQGRDKRHLACHLARTYGHKLPAMILCAGALESSSDAHLLHLERILYPGGAPATQEKTNTLSAHFGDCLAELRMAGYYLNHPKGLKSGDPDAILRSLHWSLPLWPIWYGDKVWQPLQKIATDVRSLHRELKRLLSGLVNWCKTEGPKPAPPVPPIEARLAPIASDTKLRLFDEHNEDATYRQLRGYLMSGDWSDAARLLEATYDSEEREFYLRALTRWKDRPGWMEEWASIRPSDASIWLLRGYHSIRWAWEARGEGDSDEVTPDQWKLFYERLKMAREELLKAAQLNPSDACAYAGLLKVALGLSISHEEAYGYFMEMIQRDQEHYWGHWHMLQYLCLKWHGSHDLMFRFARDISEARPAGSDIHVLLVDAHIERAAADGMPAAYFCKDSVRDELRLAYRRSLLSCFYRETRNTARICNAFALAFCYSGMKTELKEVLERMRGRITDVPWSYFGDPLYMGRHAYTVAGLDE